MFILPGHTVKLTFTLEGAMSSTPGGNQSDKMTHSAALTFVPDIYKALVVNYTYQVVPGNINLTPNDVLFEPGFVGHEQSLEIIAMSEFKIPVLI